MDTIIVSWKTPDGDVTGYRLTCAPKDAKESAGQELKVDDAKAKMATFEGLSEDTEYVIKIYTLSGDRESDRAKVSTTTSELLWNIGKALIDVWIQSCKQVITSYITSPISSQVISHSNEV